MERLTKNIFHMMLSELNISEIYLDFDGTVIDTAAQKKQIFFQITKSTDHKDVSHILEKLDGEKRELIFEQIMKLGNYSFNTLMRDFRLKTSQIYAEAEYFREFSKLRTTTQCKLNIISSSQETQILEWISSKGFGEDIDNVLRPSSKHQYLSSVGANTVLFGDGKKDFECNELPNVNVIFTRAWNDNSANVLPNASYYIDRLEELI